MYIECPLCMYIDGTYNVHQRHLISRFVEVKVYMNCTLNIIKMSLQCTLHVMSMYITCRFEGPSNTFIPTLYVQKVYIARTSF